MVKQPEFYYKALRLSELHPRFRKPLGLAIHELGDTPIALYRDAWPHESDITKDIRVGGWCTYDPPIICVVVRTLEETIHTLFHEYRHYSVHHKIFKQRGGYPSKKEFAAIDQLIENDADEAAGIMVEDFKKRLSEKAPLMFVRGQRESQAWLREKDFTGYNKKQRTPVRLLSAWMIKEEVEQARDLLKQINQPTKS